MGRVEKNSTRQTRSRPVSCLFCRSRKLRCSRQFPCPNCTSRGLPCQLDGPVASSTGEAEKSSKNLSDTFKQDVLERLHRLEDIVMKKADSPVEQTSQQPPRPWHQSHATPSSVDKSPAVDVNWLEGEVTYSTPMESLVAYNIEFRTCSIKQAVDPTFLQERNSASAIGTRCIWLPFHNEAQQMVDKYLTDITYLHHVVHKPSLRGLIDDLYRALSDGDSDSIKLGDVALLLAILSSTTFFWTGRDMRLPLFPSVEEANRQAPMWLKISLDVLECSRRKAMESLEDVQALIIVGFLISNFAGIASQVLYVFSTSMTVARRLNLHRIDHPRNGNLNAPRPDSIRAEMGRRVWWYLVGTDWQFSQFAGPQKGTYAINPAHMATDKPLNVNDQDLVDGVVNFSRPMDEPTSMTYCLQRIRLAEVCREITDSIPFLESGSEVLDYQLIRNMDARMCQIISEVPPFFSLDYTSNEDSREDLRDSTEIIIQRYAINSLINTQRCRLHLPYLVRATTDPQYGFSRDAGLQAARMVIRTERVLAKESINFALARLKFGGAMHFLCMAIIVLLMDICQNKSLHPEDGRELRVEIYNAFSVLEEAKGQSPFAERILEAFYAVLRRNQIPLPNINDKRQSLPESIADITASTAGPDEVGSISWDPSLPTFDELWQEFDNNVESNYSFDWTSLFVELEAPLVSM